MPEDSLSINHPALKTIQVKWSVLTEVQLLERWPTTPWPAERIDGGNVKLAYEAFETHVLGRPFMVPPGHSFCAKHGHFFRFIAGTPPGNRKGFVEGANSSMDAIEMIKAGRVETSMVSGYDIRRAENIMVMPDVLERPDCVLLQPPDGKDRKHCLLVLKRYGDAAKNKFLNVIFRLDEGGALALLSNHVTTNVRPNWLLKKETCWLSSQMREIVLDF